MVNSSTESDFSAMNSERLKAAIRSQKFQAFDELVERIVSDPNFTTVAVGAALFIIILTFLLIRLLSSSSASGRSILMLGLSEAGKTRLFVKLVSQKSVDTVTSMKPNEGHVKVGKKLLPLIDCPGYDRLRIKQFDDNKTKAKAIVFVLDSLEFLSNNRDVAEFLYIILSDPIVAKRKLPILVACNKQDEPKAKSSKVIAKQLEREINAIRETRTSALESTDSSGDIRVILGNPSKDFTWGDIKNPIEFVECSAYSNDDDSIGQVGTWLLGVI